MVKLLLLAGANIEVCNALGWTPLHCAARGGHKEVCEALINRPDMVAKLLEAPTAIKRIITVLCCMRQYNLPRDVIFLILTADNEIVKDFAIMLLLGTHNLKKRVCSVSITNTSSWRLEIGYTHKAKPGVIVLVPHDTAVLDARPDDITQLSAAIYGKGWGKLQLRGLDLTNDLNSAAMANPCHDIEVRIDGGDEDSIRQFTRPFRVKYYSYNVAVYEPVSVVPVSRVVIDAFRCVKYKGNNKDRTTDYARYFLQLPQAASVEMIDGAYERLKSVWEKELRLHDGNVAYVTRVLEILTAAHESLVEGAPFAPFQLDEVIPQRTFVKHAHALGLLKERFFNRRSLGNSRVVDFFTELCIEMQQLYILRKDGEGNTAYDCALDNGHDALALILSPANETVFAELRKSLKSCLRLQSRKKIVHEPDWPLTSLILTRLGLQDKKLDFNTLGFGGQVVGMVVAAPFVAPLVPIGHVFFAENSTQVLGRVALLPISIPLSVLCSIPVGLCLLICVNAFENRSNKDVCVIF